MPSTNWKYAAMASIKKQLKKPIKNQALGLK
jgi:hypothetical protein